MEDYRFDNLRVAGTIVLAIFFLGPVILFAQTSTLKLTLSDRATKLPLVNQPTTVYLNDSLLKNDSVTNSEGMIWIKNLKSGRYLVKITPKEYPISLIYNDVTILFDKTTYLNAAFEKPTPVRWSFFKKRKKKKRK